jgi:hypothetical protein
MSKRDKRLEGDIIKRIRRDSRINDAMIDVRVHDGHVLLKVINHRPLWIVCMKNGFINTMAAQNTGKRLSQTNPRNCEQATIGK